MSRPPIVKGAIRHAGKILGQRIVSPIKPSWLVILTVMKDSTRRCNVLKMLLLMAILAFPNKPANLATSLLIAGENVGLVITAEDKAAAYRYVQFLHEDGDCLNDWLTHMQPELRPIAQEQASQAGLCDS